MILLTKDKKFEFKKTVKTAIYPSELPVANKCMGSVLLHDKEQGEHPLATLGKKAHAEIEKCLKESIATKRKVYTDMKLDGDDSLLNDYLDYIYDISVNRPTHFGIECYVYDIFYNYIIGGICDLFYVLNNKLTVVDLKTGYGKMKELHWVQLYFYALCLAVKLELEGEDEVNIVFFTRWGVKKKVVTFQELLIFKNDFSRRLREEGFKFKVGPHCVDCFKFHRCDIAQRTAKNIINVMTNDKPENLEKYYKYSKFINKFFEETEKAIIEKHDKKEDIGNFNVYETPGRRYWKAEFMDKLYRNPKMIEPKLISVAQAKKKGLDIEGMYNLVKSKKAVLK